MEDFDTIALRQAIEALHIAVRAGADGSRLSELQEAVRQRILELKALVFRWQTAVADLQLEAAYARFDQEATFREQQASASQMHDEGHYEGGNPEDDGFFASDDMP